MTRVIVIDGRKVVANNTRPSVAGVEKTSLWLMLASANTSKANEYKKSKGILQV